MKSDIQQLANQLNKQFDQGEASSMKWLFQPLLELLAKGEPVSVEDIVETTGKSVEEVENILSELPSVERDEQGRVVGYGLTLIPTPHRIEVDGKPLYAWCALDTLMFPELIGRTVHIESPCHRTGEIVKLTVEPDRVVSVEPSTAVVSIVTPEQMASVRTSFCNEVHFFSSETAAKDWLDKHPEGKVVPVEDAFKLGRLLGVRYKESGNGSCCGL
ncbi:organomercurial lyase MerB [Brevibacillus agri]|uniref:Alkylmercury lyase n=1 Tax=Brevibacillus gelatini TaxID=1655277 RepID=A0A3M8B3N1_9BACL|nr:MULTISPECIES: organomercurial lyase MerB [Brevibacillus]MED4569621.1 organomercurial lyase MerB [Brevibacillus agri]RNB57940.1 organomercurial lyase MerB [Brevibacillus gelatini]